MLRPGPPRASAAIINYLKDAAEDFLDSSLEVIVDSSEIPQVPYVVKQATLLLVGDMYKNREPLTEDEVNPAFGYGYLPRSVIALLYNLRDPTLV